MIPWPVVVRNAATAVEVPAPVPGRPPSFAKMPSSWLIRGESG